MVIHDDEEDRLRRGLERWREKRLEDIEREIAEQNYIYGRAEFGLKCAHETPGVFDEDFVQDLWQDLNSAATELAQLEKQSQRLHAMELAELVVAFNRDTAQTEPKAATPPAATPENPSAQAQTIVAAWRNILGVELDPKRVEAHLQALAKWEEGWRRKGTKGHGT